ncbi:MAG TPA: flagellar hook-associated protein FlgL, partial [candidate division Zixibacteria bacterium]|nr:flagellar hook-associated protein FlgL [candidate division Zixibacteria bacterium]
MRVTNNMLANQTLFNVRRSLSSFLRIQEEMTTGRRVNKPSDDPIAVQRGLQYRTALERIEQFRTNINLGTNLLATYETSLTDMNQLVKEVVDVGLAVSNDSNNSPEAVPAFLNEVKSAIDRMLQLANSELDGRRIYAGFRTTTKPLGLGPSGFSYLGDTGAMIVEIDEATDIQLNLNAAETLLQEITPIGAQADLAVGIDGATLLSELQSGVGLDLSSFTVIDDNLGLTANIDVNVPAPPVTVNDLLSRVNTQLSAAGITNLSAAIGSDNNITLTATSNGLISL